MSAASLNVSAARVLRSFIRVYIARCERRAFAAEARRQSLAAARAAANPTSDEAAVMRELEATTGDGWR
jgi:hypothetical protein